MKMSNNHRWVRIKTLETFLQMLEDGDKVIAQVDCLGNPRVKAADIESFYHSICVGAPFEVRLIYPRSFNSYASEVYEGVDYIKWDTVAGFRPQVNPQLHTKQKVQSHTETSWEGFEKKYFNMDFLYGFYLLQCQTKSQQTTPLKKPVDIPSGGHMVRKSDGKHLYVFETPKGNYHVFEPVGATARLTVSNCKFEFLKEHFMTIKSETTWDAKTLNLKKNPHLVEAIQHLIETFVSSSGIEPDGYFDEINKDHL